MCEFISIHKTGFRLLKMIHSEDSSILPLRLLELCVSLAQIYGNLFLTAGLVDLLIQGDYGLAVGQALLLLGVNLLLGVWGCLLKGRFNGQRSKLWMTLYVWLRQKAFSLDYETMEDPRVSEKLLFTERTSNLCGGFSEVLNQYYDILRAAFNILLSVSLAVRLCLTAPVAGEGILAALARPLPSLLLFVGALTGMALCSWSVFKRFGEKQMAFFKSDTGQEAKLEYLHIRLVGDAGTAKLVRIYDMKDMILENIIEEMEKSKDYFGKKVDVGRQESEVHQAVNILFTVLSYLLVAVKTLAGAVTVGAFTQYVGALNQFGGACVTLIASHGKLRQSNTFMREFLAFLDMESLHARGSIPVEKRTDGEYELAFEHVSFHYPGSDRLVLKDVNCKLSMKGKMAVVGRNGAGKTTFIKLLCRLYEPTEGRITLNGVDIRKYDEEEYRRLFGVVFQDFKLFAFPVWENICAGNAGRMEENGGKTLTAEETARIWEALRQADAEEFVRGMPKQLDTWLYREAEDGVEISGGEAQKLALARALYKDAPVVILDEPTAALDPKAEAEVYARFNQMVEGRTSVYISHRMSSCRFCQDILVFDDGRIVERGSHEELAAAGGRYAEMWDAQAKYYNGDENPEAIFAYK